jgi:hypothetical protein
MSDVILYSTNGKTNTRIIIDIITNNKFCRISIFQRRRRRMEREERAY